MRDGLESCGVADVREGEVREQVIEVVVLEKVLSGHSWAP
jgi:hypothetical protein